MHELFIGELKQFIEAIEVFEEYVRSEFKNDERIEVLLKGAIVYSARGILGVQYNFDNAEIPENEAKKMFRILEKCFERVPHTKTIFMSPVAIIEINTTYAEDETLTEEEAVRRLAKTYAWEINMLKTNNPTPILFCDDCGLVWRYETDRFVEVNLVTNEIIDKGSIHTFRKCCRCGKLLTTLRHKEEILAYLKRYILRHPKTSRKEKMFLQELVKEKVLEAAKVAPLLI
ncbi:hypothetical protein DRN86_02040 [Candidatus Geothermarchaeota archaeon]|nr:MAG: hypothetical protein DRN86_02040 [Candidatus Geothermarchaeota archaeon]